MIRMKRTAAGIISFMMLLSAAPAIVSAEASAQKADNSTAGIQNYNSAVTAQEAGIKAGDYTVNISLTSKAPLEPVQNAFLAAFGKTGTLHVDKAGEKSITVNSQSMVMENLFGATYQANIKTLAYYQGDQLKDVTVHSTRESQYSTTFGSPDLIENITVPDKVSFPLISETEGTYKLSCTVDFMDNFLGKGNPYPTDITLTVDLEAMTPVLDTKALDAAIETANKYTQAAYTKESFQSLKDAVEAAKEALKSAQSQEELDAARQNIENAIKNLRKITVAAPAKAQAASAAYNKVKVSWNKVKDASGYEISQYNSKTKKYNAIKTTTATSYTKSGLKTGTKYVYKVRAYRVIEGKKIYSPYTAAVSAKPSLAKVTKVKAKNSAKKTAAISWKKVDGSSGYKIYRASKSNGKYKTVKTITKGKTVKYTNKNLKKGKKYYYKVRAYKNVSGKKVYGSYSSKVSVKIKR